MRQGTIFSMSPLWTELLNVYVYDENDEHFLSHKYVNTIRKRTHINALAFLVKNTLKWNAATENDSKFRV